MNQKNLETIVTVCVCVFFLTVTVGSRNSYQSWNGNCPLRFTTSNQQVLKKATFIASGIAKNDKASVQTGAKNVHLVSK